MKTQFVKLIDCRIVCRNRGFEGYFVDDNEDAFSREQQEYHYKMSLVAVAGGPGKDLEVPVEITIGTKPLRKVEGQSSSPKLTVKAAARKGSESPALSKPTRRPIVHK